MTTEYADPIEVPFVQGSHKLSRRNTAQIALHEVYPPIVLTGPYECQRCGQFARTVVRDNVVYGQGECGASEGVTTVIELAVPSGKLIVTDDLRPFYDIDDTGLESYASAVGQAQHVEAMAAIGCAYGPVLNTSPTLYRTGADTYVIARGHYDEATDKQTYPGGEALAHIITDLWAYSMADFEDWKSRGGDPSALSWVDTVVDVTPGTYRFTHHTGEVDFDWDASPVVYAHIERIT